MSRASPSKPTGGFKIEGADRGYSEAGFGPVSDTDAHVTPPPHARSKAPTDARSLVPGPKGKATPIPDFRRVARKFEEVERDRPRQLPAWLFPLIAGVVFLLFMGGGVFLLISALVVERIVDGPAQPEVIEDIDGIPVRKGFDDHR